jgi:type IV secretion system protein TrbL
LKRATSSVAESVRTSFSEGARGVMGVKGTASSNLSDSAASAAPSADGQPAWAQRMQRSQAMGRGVTLAAHAVRSGDSHGSGSSINLSESDRS